jgi:hypothetical protein
MYEKLLFIGEESKGNKGTLVQVEIPHPVTWWEARDIA